jgi:hypothetical protein
MSAEHGSPEVPQEDRDYVLGESPPDLHMMPGSIFLDTKPTPDGMEELARARLEKDPGILEHAKARGADIVTFAKAHGREITIGVGVATAAGIIGKVLYEHHKSSKENEATEKPPTNPGEGR